MKFRNKRINSEKVKFRKIECRKTQFTVFSLSVSLFFNSDSFSSNSSFFLSNVSSNSASIPALATRVEVLSEGINVNDCQRL